MYGVTKLFKFEAAHRLFTMPEDHPCRNIHGHSYVVRVSIWTNDLTNHMVIDFGKLKEFQTILNNNFDHFLILHENDPLYDIIKDHVCKIRKMPSELDVTAENMARIFADYINQLYSECVNKNGNIHVEVDETIGNTGHYTRKIE